MIIYKKRYGLFRNKAIRREIRHLDPVKDHCRIVHLLVGYEFAWDGVRALEVALMRSFCSPSVSRLLHRTGEFRRQGQKRYDDTALLVAEFMENGYDSERGRAAIAHMNKIHSAYTISNDDFLFVLSTFVLQPIDWINHYGWRKPAENEKLALFYFFREVGIRMGLKNIPASLQELHSFASQYESRYFVYSATNKLVGEATINIVKGWVPFFLRPLVFPVMTCFLDQKMLAAFGYPPPSAGLKKFVKIVMKLRAWVLRSVTFRSYPSFFTTSHNRTYPNGYCINELGPANLLQKLSTPDERRKTNTNPWSNGL